MIKLLKRKFLIVTMLSSGLTLLIILVTLNSLSYNNMVKRLDESLNNIVNIEKDKEKEIKNIPNALPDKNRGRSFSIELNSLGEVQKVDVFMYPIMETNQVINLAEEASLTGDSKGFLQDFRYLVTTENDKTRITFIDCRFEIESTRHNLITSILVYICGMVGIFILVLAFMKPAVKPIEESYKKQKRFMTDIMHEIKTPLTIIETDTEVVEMDHGKSEWTKSIKNQIAHLKTLIEELVTLLRMDEKGTSIEMERIDFSSILEDTVCGFDPLFIKKGIKLKLEEEKEVFVYGNEDNLERLVSILLENSIKYSGAQNEVTVILKKQGKKALFTVENSVKSIEKGPHKEFFDRFYRTDTSRNSATGGHGIGLSMAYEIVKNHKGKIEAYSKDEQSFTIKVQI